MVVTGKGRAVRDPFWHGLSHTVQWYNILQVEVEKQVDSLIQQCRLLVKPAIDPLLAPSSSPLSPTVQQDSLSRGSCAELLIQQCPACFGGTLFGRPLNVGSDIHVATDGNFHHWHQRSAGDCPQFYEPTYFIPKAQVDTIGHHIACARQRPSKLAPSAIPDEAIDQCEASYEAADGQKQKMAMDNFDDSGVMALICRHDIPLFLANIDTPGKQQKYGIALISHLFSLLPYQANVVVLYDVGCVLARSLSRVSFCPVNSVLKCCCYSLISSNNRSCLVFALQPLPCMRMAMNGHASSFTTHTLLLGWVYLTVKVLSDCGRDSLNLLGLNAYHL